jgi:hypothetical protein
MATNALADTPPTRAAWAQVNQMLREILESKTKEMAAD